MALLTKVSSVKNSDYSESLNYLIKKHEEKKNKNGDIVKYEPVYDENGELMERENYSISYLTADGDEGNIEDWEMDCINTNLKFSKNMKHNDRKAHHYVLSHPEADTVKGLTVVKAQQAAVEFCKRNFPGHQALICTHGDTDNIHTHIVIHSVRAREITPQPWMERGVTGEILPSQYCAGGKHTNTPKLRAMLMKEVDCMTMRYEEMTTEGYSSSFAKTKAQRRIEFMHNSVIAAAMKSKNFRDLQENLEREYDLKIERRGQSVRVFHPELSKPKRLEHIGLTPHNLTEDMFWLYEYKAKEYDEARNKWNDPLRRFEKNEKELRSAIKKQKDEELEYSRQGWNKKKNNRPYTISLYDDNGRHRTLLETMIMFAIVVAAGEIEEYMMPQWQRERLHREERKRRLVIIIKDDDRINAFYRALRFIKDLDARSEEELQAITVGNYPVEQKRKADYVLRQLELSRNREYCYEKIWTKEKSQVRKNQ